MKRDEVGKGKSLPVSKSKINKTWVIKQLPWKGPFFLLYSGKTGNLTKENSYKQNMHDDPKKTAVTNKMHKGITFDNKHV